LSGQPYFGNLLDFEGGMTIFEQHFTLKQVADATGASAQTIKAWYHYGYPVNTGANAPTGGGGPGKHRGYSLFSVMEIAVAKAILDARHFGPEQAFHAAKLFAHTGDEGRGIAVPYPEGTTVLIVSTDEALIQNWNSETKAMNTILPGKPETYVVVNISDLFDRVGLALGFDPRAIEAEGDAGIGKSRAATA